MAYKTPAASPRENISLIISMTQSQAQSHSSKATTLNESSHGDRDRLNYESTKDTPCLVDNDKAFRHWKVGGMDDEAPCLVCMQATLSEVLTVSYSAGSETPTYLSQSDTEPLCGPVSGDLGGLKLSLIPVRRQRRPCEAQDCQRRRVRICSGLFRLSILPENVP